MTTSPPSDRRRPPRLAALAWAGGGLAVALALVLVLTSGLGHGTRGEDAHAAPAPTSTIDNAAADLLQLDVVPPPALAAPDFTLTDQRGKQVSLSQLRGRSVVLSFNDDRCTDVCTLLAQDTVAATQDLGPAAKDVVFLGVNVNPFFTASSDVAAWSDQHGLSGTADWEFVTGSAAQLAKVADSYHVFVNADATTKNVTHGLELFFIDPTGRETAIGQFGTAAASTALFAHAMAQVAVDLLPSGSRTAVAGPTSAAPAATAGTSGTATLGGSAPDLTLPELGDPSKRLSLRGSPGVYTVLNFWASTCGACVQEMPDLEKAHQALGSSVDLVGVDVSDPASAASAFARTAGVTYPLVADADGTAAGAYRVPGLPFTAVIGPDGTVLVRHSGTFTAQQLEYVVAALRQG